jgi:ABC-2 type transport system permease protein
MVDTQSEDFQLSIRTVLPLVFLSGYILLIETMPPFFQSGPPKPPIAYSG